MDWRDETGYLPAMLLLLAMAFTSSVAFGLGFAPHAGIRTLAPRARPGHGPAQLLSAPCAMKFAAG